jgi:hypothetical protein
MTMRRMRIAWTYWAYSWSRGPRGVQGRRAGAGGGGSPSPAAETGATGGTGTTGGISTAEADGVGEVLVDAEGFTLYYFLPDEQGGVTCTEDCAANWPPAIVDAVPDAGDLPKELGTVENPESARCRSRTTVGRCTGTSVTPRRGRPPARAWATSGS